MIDVDGIRQILKDCNVYDKENSKNFIISCPYCGDKKKGGHKHSHCYVSKIDSVPVFNCFYCQTTGTIRKLIKDLTGNVRDDLIVPVNNKNYIKKSNSRQKIFKIPDLNITDFENKALYIQRRTFNRLDISLIQNLIFDIHEFFKINELDIDSFLTEWEKNYVQTNMVGFLSKRNSILYLRTISNELPLKFKKVILQKDLDLEGLDYYCMDNNLQESNIVVLSEGNFDILGCYSLDTLNLKSKCRAYCAGCTFSYEQLLKSVCVDFGLYNPDVIILSDADKNKYHYTNFIRNTKPFVKSLTMYYNSCGKDFGDFPHKPVRIF